MTLREIVTVLVRKIVKQEIEVEGLGQRIKDAQYQSGKTVESVIRELNISRTYWTNITKEKVDLSNDLLVRIEKCLEAKFGVVFDIGIEKADEEIVELD
jgi:transcriptional regulator with XRE-family HTH domain